MVVTLRHSAHIDLYNRVREGVAPGIRSDRVDLDKTHMAEVVLYQLFLGALPDDAPACGGWVRSRAGVMRPPPGAANAGGALSNPAPWFSRSKIFIL